MSAGAGQCFLVRGGEGLPPGGGAALCLGWWVVGVAVANGQVATPSPATSAPPAGAVSDAQSDERPKIPPLPTAAKSPVAVFRELLAMSLAERKAFLTNRPPEAQKRILAKVREYETMRPDDRELRLRVTELRWYLLPLMTQGPTNRTAQIAAVPENSSNWSRIVCGCGTSCRRLCRRSSWKTRRRCSSLRVEYCFLRGSTAQDAGKHAQERRQRLEAAITKWNSMPEEERRKIVLRFNQFFRPHRPRKAEDVEHPV